MARIRTYQRQNVPRAQLRASGSAEAFGSQVGQATQRLGQQMIRAGEQFTNEYVRRRERRNQLENERILSEFEREQQQRLRDLQQNADPGAPEFTQNYLEQLQEREQELLEDRPTRQSRQHLQQGLIQLESRLGTQAQEFEAQAAAEYEIQQVEETRENKQNAVRANPELLMDALEDMDRLSQELPVDAQKQGEFRKESRANVAFSALQGRMEGLETSAEVSELESRVRERDFWKEELTNQQYDRALSELQNMRTSLSNQEQQDYINGFSERRQQLESGRQLELGEYTPERIRATVEDSDRAERMVSQIKSSQRIGRQSQWVSMAAPQEIAERANALEQRMSQRIEDEGDFADAQREMEALQTAVERRNEQLSNDPASYVMENSRRVRREWQRYADNRTPEAMDDYVAAMESEQRRLGLPRSQVKLLPKEQVGTIAERLRAVDWESEGVEAYMQQLQGIQEEFGRHWPTVQRQLENEDVLSGPAAVAASLTAPDQRRTAHNLLRAQSIGKETLENQLGDEIEGIDAQVREELADFQNTLTDTPRGGQVYERYRESIRRLAMWQMTRDGVSVNDAVSKAREQLLDSQFSVVGRFRVPREVPYSERAITRGAQRQKRNLPEDRIVAPPSMMSGLADEDRRSQYMRMIQDNGYWVNTDGDEGVQLVLEGDPVLVEENGEQVPYTLSWDELAVTQEGDEFIEELGISPGMAPEGQGFQF